MKLLHLANFGSTNVGNGALIDGTELVIREDFPEPVEFVHEPWDEYFIEGVAGPRKFDQTFVDKVNDCDALIVGGAVMFREDHIRFEMPVGIIKPVIFYGVSYRVWGKSDYYRFGSGFRLDMALLKERSKFIMGVRNDSTQAWLESRSAWQPGQIITIPDPGLYVEIEGDRPPQIDEDRVNIAVALNDEDTTERFGNKKAGVLQNLARALVMYREQDRRVNIILCPHTFEDYNLMFALMMFFPLEMLYQNVVSSGVCRADQAGKFYDLYRCVDLVLAMRIHAMVPAIGLGTPMIALSSQKRMTEFMEDVNLAGHCLDVFDPELARNLSGLMKRVLEGSVTIKGLYNQTCLNMRQRTKAFNEKIYNFIKKT